VSRASGDYARLLGILASSDVAEGPRRMCETCVEWLPVTGAGVSVVTERGHRGTVSASDPVAARIEDLQFALGEGPCVDAFRSNSPVLVPDLDDAAGGLAGRWPGFLDAAVAAGVRALFALPLGIGAIRIGAIDLYRDSPGELSREHLDTALVIADAAALAVLCLRGRSRGVSTDYEADRSFYRLEVHQATGMMKVQLGVSMEEAFVRLQAYAFAHGRPIGDVAADVVARRLRVGKEDE
jgi:hypothetical protein